MSFSRAKRFIYKSSDVDSSPADYLFSLELHKGCSIPKSCRFEESKNTDDGSIVCSRIYRSFCPGRNNEESTKQTRSVNNKTCTEFNGNRTLRKFINARRKNDKNKVAQVDTNNTRKNVQNMSLYDIQEYIDDDYGSMTSSEEDLKNIEEFELNEIYNILKRLQQKRNRTSAKNRSSTFEDTVLKKLDVIDRNVKIIKEDVAYIPPNSPVHQLRYGPNTENADFAVSCHFQPINEGLIKNIIMKAIQNLGKNIESKTRSIKKISEEHILNMIAAMYATNAKSNREIKELCNTTAEEIVQKLNQALQTTEYSSESEIENTFEELKNQYFTDKILHSSNLHNIITDYLEQTQEVGEELEEDFSDITLKCMDTQQMLNVQGAILDEMKNEIQNLKSNFL